MSYLGLLDWSLIIDFNQNTEIDGLFKYARTHMEERKKVHLYTFEDPFSFSAYNSAYWLAANGLTGRQRTLTNDYKSWNRKYLSFLNKFFSSFFKTFGDKPTNVIILWDDAPFIQKLCELIDFANGEKTKFIYAIQDQTKLLSVNEIYEGSNIEISIPKIAAGILRIRSFYNSEFAPETYMLPSKDQEHIFLSKNDFLWIEEDLEIVYRNILDGVNISDLEAKERDRFFKGNQITWQGLQLHHDIDREITHSIKRRIEKALRDRNTEKILLHHYPGIGGTTISRRIAWDIKDDSPVLVLRKYRPLNTVDKIFKVFDLTKKSILLVAEASEVNIDDINRLFDEMQSRNFPCVCFVVQRNDNSGLSTFYLEDLLTDIEFQTFLAKYKELCPQKKSAFDQISKSFEKKERHPFYLGLTAFEENFNGLPNFVKRNIQGATEIQKKVISIIGLCYYFGQKVTSAQIFSTLLACSENSIVYLDNHLNNFNKGVKRYHPPV